MRLRPLLLHLPQNPTVTHGHYGHAANSNRPQVSTMISRESQSITQYGAFVKPIATPSEHPGGIPANKTHKNTPKPLKTPPVNIVTSVTQLGRHTPPDFVLTKQTPTPMSPQQGHLGHDGHATAASPPARANPGSPSGPQTSGSSRKCPSGPPAAHPSTRTASAASRSAPCPTPRSASR